MMAEIDEAIGALIHRITICSFCMKSRKQVKVLIAGPTTFICNECIELCSKLVEEKLKPQAEEKSE